MSDSINSESYWDRRFSVDWETFSGPDQSRFFSRVAANALPSWLVNQCSDHPLTIADWGCAQGDGTNELAKLLRTARVSGIDFSKVAIAQARLRYPSIDFICADWLMERQPAPARFDVVFSSNVIEHFHDPFGVLNVICQKARKAVLLAIPYRETNRHEEHFFTFLPENVPLTLSNGFRLAWAKVIDCASLPNTHWQGEQILLVYGDAAWLDGLGLHVSDCIVEHEDTEANNKKLSAQLSEKEHQLNLLQIANNQQLRELQAQIASAHLALSQSVSVSKAEIQEHAVRHSAERTKLQIELSDTRRALTAVERELAENYKRFSERERLLNDSLLAKEQENSDQVRLFAESETRALQALSQKEQEKKDLLLSHASREREFQLALKQKEQEKNDLMLSHAERERGFQLSLLKKDQEIVEQKQSRAEQVRLANLEASTQERSLSERLTKLQALADEWKSIAHQHQAQNSLILRSKYWRWTAPLRRIFGFPHHANTDTFRRIPTMTTASTPDATISMPAPTTKNSVTQVTTAADLLGLNGEKFLDHAYQLLLGRPPDSGGLRHYRDRLRKGVSKIDILSQVKKSKEAQAYDANVPGLNEALRRYRWGKLPFMGWLRYKDENPVYLLRAIEAQLAELDNKVAIHLRGNVANQTHSPSFPAKVDEAVSWGHRATPGIAPPPSNRDATLLPRDVATRIDQPTKSRLDLAAINPAFCGLTAKLVSVVLPVFNQADLLAESIDSVLAQTYQHFELIIVNDGSTDNIERVLERYNDKAKVHIYHQTNQKLPKALSNGFSLAKGEYWTWTSADNIMDPRMLEMLVAKLAANPNVGMVYADYHAIDDRGKILGDPKWRAHNRPNLASGEIHLPKSVETLNSIQDNFIGPCFMYRGFIGLCLGDYDTQLGIEDYDYWMRVNSFFRIEHLGVDNCLYKYRVHDNTLSANANEHRIFEKVQRLMLYEKERAQFYRQPINYFADDVGATWLMKYGVPRNTIMPMSAMSEEVKQGFCVAVIGITSLLSHIKDLRRSATPAAIIYDDTSADYTALSCLSEDSTIVLTNDELSASRSKMVSSCVVLDGTSRQSLNATEAFFKNKAYMRLTRRQEDLARTLPTSHDNLTNGRVLLQVDNFTQGGMENVVIDLAISLGKLGIDVALAILGKEGPAADKARAQGLTVTSFKSPPSPTHYQDYLRQSKVVLVNGHYSIFGAELCAAMEIPFVQTIHNSYVWLEPDQISNYRRADAFTSTYICVSATAARYADVALGLDRQKMRIVPNGIDPKVLNNSAFESDRKILRRRWQVDDNTPVFLNVASILTPKAQLPLVNALSLLVKSVPSAKLVILGGMSEPAYGRKVTKRISQLNLQDHVLLPGYDGDVAKYYHAADVFVLPSYWEGWSLSLAEARANGLPCVITDVGSSYEHYGSNNVEIVKPPFADITKLNYSTLGKFIYDRDEAFEQSLCKAMLAAAKLPRHKSGDDLIKRLDRENAYKTYAAVFSQALRQKKFAQSTRL